MTETIQSSRSSPHTGRLRSWSRFRPNFSGVLLVLIGAIVGFGLGWRWSYHVVQTVTTLAMQFKAENDKLKDEISNKNAAVGALQADLSIIQAMMDSMAPSQNAYSINANQSVTVAGGQLTVGLIGSPTYDRVNININGRQQSLAVGDIVNVAVDASTACQVAVQSFDMFRAVLTASCSAAKPQ